MKALGWIFFGMAALGGAALTLAPRPESATFVEQDGAITMGRTEKMVHPTASPQRKDKVVKTEAEWKKILTEEQFKILRKSDTEPAFCTPWHGTKREGSYHCAGCKLELFLSSAKFESGTGWPSFLRPIKAEDIWVRTDRSYGMVRSETLCSRCDGHLGHVFDDGPAPTGLRYCINSKALLFKAKGSKVYEIPE